MCHRNDTFSDSLQCKILSTINRKERYQRVFKEFDKNGDGKIDKSELKEVFRAMGRDLSDKEAKRMIQLADIDKSGALNYTEFITEVFGVKK